MILTVPDSGLGELLASQQLLLQLWPHAARDVMMLLHVLHLSMPSLADALAIGLVTLHPVTRQVLALSHGRAVLVGVGRRDDGSEVRAPQEHLCEITSLEVRDVRASGRSGLRAAA